MMYPDEIQPQEQKEQSNTLNEIIPSASDLDEKIETQTIPTNQQVAESYEPNQPIEVTYVSSIEDNSTDAASLTEESITPPVDKIEKELTLEVSDFQEQKQNLTEEIATLQETKAKLQQEVMAQTKAIGRLVPEALSQLEERKQTLQVEVEKLERRKERIQREMRTTFAGASQDLAIRIQGFKDYLVGSLQDLAAAAEQLELAPQPEEYTTPVAENTPKSLRNSENPKFAEMGFEEQNRQIRQILDEYRNMPDYYGQPWRLRRTFEPIHAERVSNWFFSQGGRGALRTMGSRLQNILVASAIISVLRDLYDTRVRALVLANSPERLGEWRRGLQDCLGIDRRDFSPDRGVALFEDAEILAQKADRFLKQGKLPIIVIDDTEDKISLSMLQFPLWLAFAPEPNSQNSTDRF
ncbi:DUF3086 domain-containing protein [Dapis sp. BLCC M126]|uniref:DUF3086 domain-containing protein n=1 Tax=Dapis sp. BLCC M126 TaxID=3400189 RepID=UPI003CECC32D